MKPAVITASAIAILTSTTTAQGDGGGSFFYDTCAKTWSLGFRQLGHFLVAACPGGDGANHTSTLDLNDCLGNAEGELRAERTGFAFRSCYSCTASSTSAEITCTCRSSWGGPKTSLFDLNTLVKNDDGILSCFDLPGFEITPPEEL